MPSKVIKTVLIDPDRHSYRDFFTTCQAQSLFGLNDDRFDSLIDNLGFAWRSAAYAAGMPGQMSGQIPRFLAGLRDYPASDDLRLTESERLLGLLLYKLPLLTADPSLISELRTTINELQQEMGEARARLPIELDEDDLWQLHLESAEFQFYVLSSQRFCFLTSFAAYEVFLVGFVRLLLGDESIRITDRNPRFSRLLEDAVGTSTASKVWSAPDIACLREIRNSLLHERGRITKKLQPYESKLRLSDGEIQIFPSDNKRLFAVLLERVQLLFQNKACT